MKRTVERDLLAWKESAHRKPLLVQGARQVGKTYAIKAFGAKHFRAMAYINFFNDESMIRLFDGDLAPKRLLDAISLQTDADADDPGTLIVFDEIQECPRALTSLKMFCEERPDLPIIGAGSLLGIALHRGASFPVGKVEHLSMYPMTFFEFLRTIEPRLCAPLADRDYGLLSTFHERYTELLKQYLLVGGMPEAARTFKDTGSYDEARHVQERLLHDYELDFSKYADPALSEKIRMLWAAVPTQLGRQNRKFLYSAIRKGARARGYEEAIQWLVDAGLILRVNRISKPGLPLASYQDRNAFKLYLLDTGLLAALSGVSPLTILEGDRLFTEFKGALAENYVCQQLIGAGRLRPSYWSAENSTGEVDFVYDHEGAVVPLEVKAELNLKAKSLRSFLSRYGIERGLRLSLAGFEEQSWVVNLPLYAADALPDWQAHAG